MDTNILPVATVIVGVVMIAVGIAFLVRAKRYPEQKDRLFLNRIGIGLAGVGLLIISLVLGSTCRLYGNPCVTRVNQLMAVIINIFIAILLFGGAILAVTAGRFPLERWRRIGIRLVGIFAFLGGVFVLVGKVDGWIH
jgi:hypothetical protein